MKQVLTITLNPALDKLVPLGHFASKNGNRGARAIVSAGGKGLNVSRTLSCLGSPTMAMAIIGGTSGRKIDQHLRKEKIKSSFVRIKEESRTNLTLRDALTKNRRRIMGMGPIIDDETLSAFEKKFVVQLKRSAIVTFNGRMILGAPKDYYARLIRMAKREKVKSILDTNGDELVEGLKAKPFLIKPNLKEAQEALNLKINSLSLIKRALKRFQKMGVKITLLTLGARGAAGIFKDQIWYCRPPKVKIYHDVGCGDAFLGSFIHANLNAYSFSEGLRFASCCATLSAQGKIPGAIRLAAINRELNSFKLREL